MPEEGLKQLALEDIVDFDAACEEDVCADDVIGHVGEEVEGVDKSKNDTPMRESPRVDCGSRNEDKEDAARMED